MSPVTDTDIWAYYYYQIDLQLYQSAAHYPHILRQAELSINSYPYLYLTTWDTSFRKLYTSVRCMSFYYKPNQRQWFANPIYGRLPTELQLIILDQITPPTFYSSTCEPCPQIQYLSIDTISCGNIPNIEYILHREVYNQQHTSTTYPICITPWDPKPFRANIQVAPIRYGYALANLWTSIDGNSLNRIYTTRRKRFAIYQSHKQAQEARRLLK